MTNLEFPPEVVLFPPEVGLNQLIFQKILGFTCFVAKSFENLTWICSKYQFFSSNFLSDFVIVAKSWLKKGPKKEN